ncbi:ABC transporter permease [Stygiobacter electus]|uniref:Transport permease protein n=1 Tax=Stygiobacter electus TaxID=3032292 RepID=A0AAE3TBR8_9BACT|nr:ABC transporter permease [Stygiobacter electus]MDF1611608.1 ABC transporter permease [Stygiobacter electus]
MKQLISFIQKEFYHILRDKRSLLILLGLPIVQLLLFGFAITTEVRNAKIVIFDNSKDLVTQQIISKIQHNKYFILDKTINHPNQIEDAFKEGKIRLAIIFQNNFQNDLLHNNKAQIQIIADATDPNQATTLINYISSIINDFQQDLYNQNKIPYTIKTEFRMLYNPQLKGAYSSVPGVMGMILLLISAMMTSISIVRERETGTMEVLLVSPMKPWFVVLSKVIPYFVISIINVITILLLSVFVLGMPIKGSILLLAFSTLLYIFCALSLGVLISTIADTQQAAMIISIIGLMLPVVMLSGYAFPIANMPELLQIISNVVPAKWYIIIVKSIMLKGLGFSDVFDELIILTFMTLVFLLISIKRFKVRL